jgi:hypothetical protein
MRIRLAPQELIFHILEQMTVSERPVFFDLCRANFEPAEKQRKTAWYY